MSKPDQEHALGTEEVAQDAPFLQGTAQVRGETAVSAAANATRPAGASSPQPALASPRHLAFGMLRSTVEEMTARGATPYAAGVSARVRQADPAFNLIDLGFSSFKAFLQAAAEDGFVEISRPSGASDVFVSIPEGGESPGTSMIDSSRYLLPEIWRTLTSSSGKTRRWDRIAARLSDADTAGGVEADASMVELRPIPTDEVVGWMRTFVGTLHEAEVSKALADALASPRPADAFKTVVRGHQGVSRKWGKYYRDHVTRRAFEWADVHGIRRAEIIDWPREGATAPPAVSAASARAAVNQRPRSKASAMSSGLQDAADYEALVRSRIAEAVARMPLADLLRLPIPAQYLIRG